MNRDESRLASVIVIAIVVVLAAIGLAQPHFEAQSFNKLIGGHATYWDALWADLRVIGDGGNP